MLGFPRSTEEGHPLAAVYKPAQAHWFHSRASPSWGMGKLVDSVSFVTQHQATKVRALKETRLPLCLGSEPAAFPEPRQRLGRAEERPQQSWGLR